jgi:nitrite reductase/ring-hydroxylating ferredoxin subunit
MDERSSMEWIYVLDEATLLDGHMVPAYPKGVNVVMARVGGVVYALSGKCVHMACPLFTGQLNGYIITCRCHDWQYDIRTGKFLDAPELGLTMYSIKSEEGKVFVNLK